MQSVTANLNLHRSTGWLSGTVGTASIARRAMLSATARNLLQPALINYFERPTVRKRGGLSPFCGPASGRSSLKEERARQ